MEEVVQYVLYSLMTAALGLFIQKCFQEGMIFRKYYLLLIYFWIKWHKRKDRWKRFVLPPLGMCIYCNGTWIAIVVYFLNFNFGFDIFLFLGLNYLWIEIFKKHLNL